MLINFSFQQNFFPNFFNVMLQLRRQYLLLFTKIFSGWINVKCNFYFPYPIFFFIFFCSIMCSLVVPKYQNVFWSTLIRDFCQFPVNICYNLPIISKHHTFVKSYKIHNHLHRTTFTGVNILQLLRYLSIFFEIMNVGMKNIKRV